MYMNECFRLHRLLKKFLLKSGLASTSIAVAESSANFFDDLNQQSIGQPSLGKDQASIAETNQQVNDLMERISFLKNQSAKLKGEAAAHKQLGDSYQSQLKALQAQNKELAVELERHKND